MLVLAVICTCMLLCHPSPILAAEEDNPPALASFAKGIDMVSMAENTMYDSIDLCYASCSSECTSPDICKCYFQDMTKTKAYSKCSRCAAGSYVLDDSGGACVSCEPGTFNTIGSWFPMQITYKSKLYNFTGMFSDGFPIYNNQESYVWWWVYLWLEYWERVGGNYGHLLSGPGGYFENGQFPPIQHLVNSISSHTQYCLSCPTGTFADRLGASACTTCNTDPCPTGYNKTSCPKGSTQDSQCVQLAPAPLLTVATVTVNATYAQVCSNLDYYVNGYCNGLKFANPADNITCLAQGLNGVPCPNGICLCNTFRRLLTNSESANLNVQATHLFVTLQPPTARVIPWLIGVSIASTCPVTGCHVENAPSTTSDSAAVIGGAVGGSVGGVLLLVGIFVYWRRNRTTPSASLKFPDWMPRINCSRANH